MLVLLAVRNEDTTVVSLGLVEFAIEPDACSFALADLLVMIKHVSEMAGHSRSVDERQGALFNHRAAAFAIADKFNNKQAYFVVELGEVKLFVVFYI